MVTEQDMDLRLLNADVYRLLASCFDFPTAERLEAIRDISEKLKQADLPDEEIRATIATLHDAIDSDEILNDYSLIFIKGAVPLSESHTMRKFSSVSDVAAFYSAFGFRPKAGENPDSIMHQLEFLALLLVKDSIAPNEEAKEVTRNAYKEFLKEHTGEFAVALAQRIREGNAGTYFFTVSFLLEAFITQELSAE
jgi:TorA maturation chaperone TorD